MTNSPKYLQFGLSTLLVMGIWVIVLALLYTHPAEAGYGRTLYAFATIFGYIFFATAAVLLMMRWLTHPFLQQTFVYNLAGTANLLVGITYCITFILLKTDHLHLDFFLNLSLGTAIVIDIIRS